MTEFDIIKTYFTTQTEHRPDVVHGIGDDTAIVRVPPDQELAITTDTQIEGVHFPSSSLPYDIGYKSLAVNLSDLAAMGATPAWVTLALTLPPELANPDWLQGFCDGFFTLANRFQVQLIGGNLAHGPLSITIQALGFVPHKKAILRSRANPGDLIYVTGTLGDAGLGLKIHLEHLVTEPQAKLYLFSRLNRPEPRIATGEQLRDLASAAIDISDGFAADLGHILEQSDIGAEVNVDKLPLSEELKQSIGIEEAIKLALTSGDDYELCFTVPPEKKSLLEKKLSALPCRFTCVGMMTKQKGLALYHQDGKKYHGAILGYQHF